MKIGIFSDLHGHNFREFSYIDQDGFNSRLMHQAEVLQEIHEKALKVGLDCILFLGDFTHLKNNCDSQVIKVLSYIFGKMAEDLPIYIIPGNHDYRLWGSEPALLEVLENVSSKITILSGGLKTIGDKDFYCLPYARKTKNLNEQLKNIDSKPDTIFLGHQDVLGVSYGGYTVTEGLDANILSKGFRWAFIGHCHESMHIKNNVISVGAPLEHNFGDEGKKHGWWILDTDVEDNEQLQFLKNVNSPKFITLHYDLENSCEFVGDPEKDFYRVILDNVTIPEEVKAIKYKRIMQKRVQDSTKRSAISITDSTEDIIGKYVKSKNYNNLDGKKLVSIGRKLL